VAHGLITAAVANANCIVPWFDAGRRQKESRKDSRERKAAKNETGAIPEKYPGCVHRVRLWSELHGAA
jgi:hypothetical protein